MGFLLPFCVTKEWQLMSITPRIKSADEVLSQSHQEVPKYWGKLLREKGRLAVIGAAKSNKSFFAIQLGLCMATGKPFLEIPTTVCNVLYLNFEISEESFQERLSDVTNAMDLDEGDWLKRFNMTCPR
jgi:RecA-family ATPase